MFIRDSILKVVKQIFKTQGENNSEDRLLSYLEIPNILILTTLNRWWKIHSRYSGVMLIGNGRLLLWSVTKQEPPPYTNIDTVGTIVISFPSQTVKLSLKPQHTL